MAIQVNGTQVIGNSRELTNIASVDATTAAAIGAAGVGGGGTVDLTADGSISSGDVVGVSGNGTVASTRAFFGPTVAFVSSVAEYVCSYWDQAANKVVVAWSSGNYLYLRVGTISSSSAITWGTAYAYNNNSGPFNVAVAMHNNVIVATFGASNWGTYRMGIAFGVSGTTINSNSGVTYVEGSVGYSYYGDTDSQSLMADPNNSGKFIQVLQGEGNLRPYVALITATSSSISSTVTKVTNNNSSCSKVQLAYNPASGKFMGLWIGNWYGANSVTAASLTVSGSSLSIGTVSTTDLSQSSDQTGMGYSSTTGNFLYFVRDGGKLFGWSLFTNASGNATGWGSPNEIVTASGSDWIARYTYNSSGITTVGAWQMGDGINSKLYLIKDTAGGVLSVDGDPIDISDTASASMNRGGPWGMQGKGSFVSFNGQTSPYYSSELNTASTVFTALGISEGNYTNGQTATITIPGGVTNTVSGLTSGAYYQPSFNTSGGLDGGGAFAQALDTNKLLVK